MMNASQPPGASSDADDLFVYVTLPQGWRIEPTNHSMWSDLLDEQGRERAGIFYKAAFYDRNACIILTRRYSCGVEPLLGWEQTQTSSWAGVVKDQGHVIWQTDSIEPRPEGNTPEANAARSAWYERESILQNKAREWLTYHFPQWQDPLAYW